ILEFKECSRGLRSWLPEGSLRGRLWGVRHHFAIVVLHNIILEFKECSRGLRSWLPEGSLRGRLWVVRHHFAIVANDASKKKPAWTGRVSH
ncbi:hypothetical protein, partial [Halobacteriovorax sp. ZH5_bin.2]|uniref:hypothetical protein n=1 Tax=Halobacteriovorax sp. ZH5_bin.2 TaxID=3157727 RepID=UPI0037186BDE